MVLVASNMAVVTASYDGPMRFTITTIIQFQDFEKSWQKKVYIKYYVTFVLNLMHRKRKERK